MKIVVTEKGLEYMNQSFKKSPIKKSYPRLHSVTKFEDPFPMPHSTTHKRNILQQKKNHFSQENLISQSFKLINISSESEDVQDEFVGKGVPSRIRIQPRKIYEIDITPYENKSIHSKSPSITTTSQKDIKLNRIQGLHDKKAKERDEYIRRLKEKLNVSRHMQHEEVKIQVHHVIKTQEDVLHKEDRGKRIYAKYVQEKKMGNYLY